MCDGDIFEGNIEFLCSLEEVRTNAVRNSFTLGNQFCSVELGDDGFEDFIADRGENSLVVVLAEILDCFVRI